jgi:hypothetical protein
MELVGGKQFFSSFDFQSGIHQIEIEPESIERKAFAKYSI